MRYTKRTLVISQANVVDAEQRVARQRDVVEQLEECRHPSVHAIALLLVMEQSLLSMKRFLATVERELELAVGSSKPKRTKAARRRTEADTDQFAQQVVEDLRDAGLDAKHSGADARAETRTADPVASIASR
jgi:hypothetical protein